MIKGGVGKYDERGASLHSYFLYCAVEREECVAFRGVFFLYKK